ncbi:MAG: hypothetical protein IPJ79_04565 [Bacteroidetes bacterium]|nr:hypothetical protein [Bacteroidota bacterium]
MLQTLKNISLLLLLSLFISCCKNDDNGIGGDDKTIRIPQEVKDYMQFKTGTWWLYEDSVSLATDCVYVTASAQGFDTVYEAGHIKQIYEYFTWECYNTFENLQHRYYVHQSWSTVNTDTKVFYNKFDNINSTTMVIFLYPYILNKYYGSGFFSYDTTYYQNVYSNYNVDTIQFTDVVQTLFKNYDYEINKDTKFYLAKQAGIVRRDIPDRNRFWKIKAYHLIK